MQFDLVSLLFFSRFKMHVQTTCDSCSPVTGTQFTSALKQGLFDTWESLVIMDVIAFTLHFWMSDQFFKPLELFGWSERSLPFLYLFNFFESVGDMCITTYLHHGYEAPHVQSHAETPCLYWEPLGFMFLSYKLNEGKNPLSFFGWYTEEISWVHAQ